MDAVRVEIRRLHNVCREKDEALWQLIQGVEGFLRGPLSAQGLADLEQAIAQAKDSVAIYRRAGGDK